ncbi:MAG: hypothetical protein PHD09_03860, partial [Candidatus Omnitrophica bacterium]|nr:hypothetical protein [Candidatus Omnitrophota bacterium]
MQHKAQSIKRKVAVQNSKLLVLSLSFALCALNFTLSLAEEPPTSGDLIVKAWAAHGKKDVEATFKYTQEIIDLYAQEADQQQASLKSLPKSKDEINAVASLNNVATAYFIQGESYRDQEKIDQSVE